MKASRLSKALSILVGAWLALSTAYIFVWQQKARLDYRDVESSADLNKGEKFQSNWLGPIGSINSKLTIGEGRFPNGETLFLSDIFITLRTSEEYHSTRLEILLRTWWNAARNQTFIFTDVDDLSLTNHTEGRLMNTHCDGETESEFQCCIMGVEYDAFSMSGRKWWCHFDDETYVNVEALLRLLRQYNSQHDEYLGRPGTDERFVATYQGHNVQFNFASAAGGFCMSKSLTQKIAMRTKHGRLEKTCQKLNLPGDRTLGFIIHNQFGVDITPREEFNSNAKPLWQIPRVKLKSQVTLAYQIDDERRLNLVDLSPEKLGFTESQDPTRFLSLHCFLYPDTEWCPLWGAVDY